MGSTKLVHGFHKSVGRNNRGIITVRHRERGHKKLYRRIQFKRNTKNLLDKKGKVQNIEYDPNRNVYVALIHTVNSPKQFYEDNERKFYILHPLGLQVGDTVMASENASTTIGNSLPLKNIPLGFTVHNVELTPGKGGQLIRAGGTGAQLLAKEGKYITLRLPSGEVRFILNSCWATIGELSLRQKTSKNWTKAGKFRWLGKRPNVRGVARNPVDHPHGGGEGRASIGRSKPYTPWGKPTLGVKTRSPKKYSNNFILRSRNLK